MKLFNSTDQNPVLKNNMELNASDTLHVRLHYETRNKCVITTEMVQDAKLKIETALNDIFDDGVSRESIDIADTFSNYLLDVILRQGFEIASLKARMKSKWSFLRMLGLRREDFRRGDE